MNRSIQSTGWEGDWERRWGLSRKEVERDPVGVRNTAQSAKRPRGVLLDWYYYGGLEVICGFPNGKESSFSEGDPSSVPEQGRSPGEGNGYPLQYSSLENPTDRGAWQTIVHRVAKNWTQLKWLSMYRSIMSILQTQRSLLHKYRYLFLKKKSFL